MPPLTRIFAPGHNQVINHTTTNKSPSCHPAVTKLASDLILHFSNDGMQFHVMLNEWDRDRDGNTVTGVGGQGRGQGWRVDGAAEGIVTDLAPSESHVGALRVSLVRGRPVHRCMLGRGLAWRAVGILRRC